MKPIRPGDPLTIAPFNEIAEGMVNYAFYGSGTGGATGRAGRPMYARPTGDSGWFYALLFGAGNPYSWVERKLDATGAWVAGTRTGAANAYEVNLQTGLGGKIARLRAGHGDYRFQYIRQGGCDPVCVTVTDLCGPHPSPVIYNEACDVWIDTRIVVTDANGAHPYSPTQTWVPTPYATDLLTFASANLWDSGHDCVTKMSGTGLYGYYWKFHATTVTLTLRVYVELCPFGYDPANPVADSATQGILVAEYDSEVAPTCGWAASCSFAKPATRTSFGAGDFAHGSSTLPVASASMAGVVKATNYLSGALVEIKDRTGTTVASCTTNNSGRCCVSAPSPDQYWVSVSKDGCAQPNCALVTQEINPCPPVCVETVSCTACGGVELTVLHGTMTVGGTTTNLTYSPFGYWQSPTFSFGSDTAFANDSFYHTCTPTPGAISCFYRFYCSGDVVTCEAWTYPIKHCTSGNVI